MIRLMNALTNARALTRRRPIVVASISLVAASVGGVLVARAGSGTQGGTATDVITYSGTLGGVAAGSFTFTFTFHKNGQSCQPPALTASIDASGAFDVPIDTSQASMQGSGASCATFAFPTFDGSPVTVDVAVTSGATSIASIAGQSISAVPYAKYSDVAVNATGPITPTSIDVSGNVTVGGRIALGTYRQSCTPNQAIYDCACNTGDVAIGGGGYAYSGGGNVLRESDPTPGNSNAWRVTCAVVNGGGSSFDNQCQGAFAVCLSHAQ
jgi:hypothetical protein